MLDSQFAHIGKIRATNRVCIGPSQGWAVFSEEVYPKSHIVLRILGQPVPPVTEFICELNFPRHVLIMYLFTYIVKGITPTIRLAFPVEYNRL